MDIRKLAKQLLSQKDNMRYKLLLAKKRGSYGQWLEQQALLWQEENEACLPGETEDGDYVFLCVARGTLTSYARKSIICYFMQHPEVQLLYGDEDVREEKGKACFPDFKPDWSPDVLDSCFYFGSIVAMRKDFFARVREAAGRDTLWYTVKGNDLLAADFPAYARWIRYCVEVAGGYEKGARSIGHVAQILFHCGSLEEQARYRQPLPCLQERAGELSEAFYRGAGEEGAGELSEAFCREDEEGAAGPSEGPAVSVIIPSRDHVELLEKCLRAVINTAEGLRLEMVVVDNGSQEENRERAEKLIRELSCGTVEASYLYRPMEFNFSRMCNLGAEAARGRFLLFLNDDVELAVPGCIGQMASLASRPYTGAVGMKLYYPGSERIQHMGITNLPMGPVHKLQFLEDGEAYGYTYHGNVNYLAVTAACLMTGRDRFREAGGFSEELQVAFNDVDLCFTLYETGYHNVCMNGCYAYHHESLSRGEDESVEKLERLLEEREKLYERHPGLVGKDPYFSVHFSREGLDTKIRPACQVMGNAVQEYDKFLVEKTLYDHRRDECVMVRIETVQPEGVCGWAAVLGDNNACYDKSLMLKKVSEVFSPEADEWFRGPSGALVIPLSEQYRPDLVENMPDQVNVGLCGFHVRLKANLLPPGRYRVGVAVKHRITGAGLMNWSNRFLEVL